MKRLSLALLAIAILAVCHSQDAAAQHPFGYGFQPFGFYQPYGAQFGTSVRTPPYFATNPPVYYGARHSRPYGISPFASPPVVTAPSTYTGRLRSTFADGPHITPVPATNPFLCQSSSATTPGMQVSATSAAGAPAGPIRTNPFVNTAEQLANN